MRTRIRSWLWSLVIVTAFILLASPVVSTTHANDEAPNGEGPLNHLTPIAVINTPKGEVKAYDLSQVRAALSADGIEGQAGPNSKMSPNASSSNNASGSYANK